MTLNAKFWGRDPEAAQLEVLKRFDNLARIKPAVQAGKAACLKVLAGVVNHIAPAGQRMPIYSLSGVTSQIPDNRVKYENIPKLG